MKRNKILKRMLSLLLAVVLVAGTIGAFEPSTANVANAAEENLITNGDFAQTESWVDQDDITVSAQTEVEAVNTVYAYQDGFDTGADSYTYVSGEGSHAVENMDGNQVLKMTNVSTDSDWYTLGTTVEGIKVESGKTYDLSFKVKSVEASKGLCFVLFVQSWDAAGESWAYSGENVVNVTATSDGWTDVTMQYTVPENYANVQLRIQERWSTVYYIDDVSVYYQETEMVQQEKKAFSDGFDTGADSYTYVSGEGSHAVENMDGNQVLKMTNVSTDSDWYTLGTTVEGIKVESGKTYDLSFKVKSVEASKGLCFVLFVQSWDAAGESWAYSGENVVNVTATSDGWTDVTMQYTVPENHANVQLRIQERWSTQYYIDDVKVSYTTMGVATTYTEGVGTCVENSVAMEADNVLSMKEYTEVKQPVTLAAGTYNYSFAVKSVETGSDFVFGIKAGSTTKEIATTSEWQTVSGTLELTDSASTFGFYRSGVGEVLIDDVVLISASAAVTDHTPELPSDYIPEGVVNLIDGDFTDDTHEGIILSNETYATVANGVAKIQFDDNNVYVQTNNFTAVKGHTYVLSYYIWLDSANEIGINMAQVNVGPGGPTGANEWIDYLWNFANTEGGFTATFGEAPLSENITADTDGWKKVQITWTAQENGDFALILLRNYLSGTGNVYLDDVALYDMTEQIYTTEITSKTITGFKPADYYAINIDMTDTPDLSTTIDYQEVLLLSNTATATYLDICGIDAEALVEYGVQVKYIPTANVFQLVLGTDYTWLTVGAEITFKEGMPIPVIVNDETVTVTLQNTITYRVDSVTEEAPYVTMSAYAQTQEFYINPAECDGIQNETVVNLWVYDAAGETTILDDCGQAYDSSRISYTTMAKYIDFCDFNASDLEKYGVFVRLAAGDGNELMQIYPGTMPTDMIEGETITLKKGLPITYTTTAGYKKTITLAQDYTFVIGAGLTMDGVTYDCRWMYTDTEPSIWRMKSGELNQVLNTGAGEGDFNNLPLGSSPLLDEQTSLTYTFTANQLKKYVDFAGLDTSTYGVNVIVYINGNDKVLQLQWGTTTDDVNEGDTITFKAGLPIVVDGTVIYKLEADVVYTIEESANGANGFCLNNIIEITNTKPGDADGDYIQNVNDVNLIREALAELVITDVKTQDATEDKVVNSIDLVRAKKEFDIEESEENGTETYTLLADKEVGFRTMAASTNDTKADATSITYELNADLGTKTYLRLTYKTDTDLRGEFIYTVDGNAEVTEEFFLEANKAQFEQFLDVYRSNGLNGKVSGATIVLKKIVLYNLSTTNPTDVRLYKIEAAARTLVTDDMIWAQGDDVKIGVDLNMGGTLAWMECLKYEIYEYIDSYESIIGTKEQCEESGGTAQNEEGTPVNLINIYDLGRQVQQSYYSVPTSQNNWDGNVFAKGSWSGGSDWPYNPVQAGDNYNNQSQIVDYRAIDTDGDKQSDVIYVKVRAMEWASSNVTTDSYMEAWYRINDALVYVDNRFIDWSGYDYSTEDRTQELPAAYFGQGLNTLVSDKAGTTQKNTNLGSWTASDAYVNTTTTTDWYAFVNSEDEDAFGVGIYIPNVEQTVAGRVYNHRKTAWVLSGATANKNADECPLFDLDDYSYLKSLYQDNKYQNCFVSNASYIAPVCSGYMQGYEDYSYTYVLTADTLNNISGSFATLKENNTVDNSSLEEWEINPNKSETNN